MPLAHRKSLQKKLQLDKQNKKKQHFTYLSHLEVLEGNSPLIGRVLVAAWHQQRPASGADGLAAVRVFSRGVNVPAAVERGLGAVVVQLHRVQSEPAASRHLVVTLAHCKATHTHTEHQEEVTYQMSGGVRMCECVSAAAALHQLKAAVSEDVVVVENQPDGTEKGAEFERILNSLAAPTPTLPVAACAARTWTWPCRRWSRAVWASHPCRRCRGSSRGPPSGHGGRYRPTGSWPTAECRSLLHPPAQTHMDAHTNMSTKHTYPSPSEPKHSHLCPFLFVL